MPTMLAPVLLATLTTASAASAVKVAPNAAANDVAPATAASAPKSAHDARPADRSGLMPSVGIGNSYAGIGAQVAYLVHGVPLFRQLGPYGSVGFLPAPHDVPNAADYAFGVIGALGNRHRLVFDLGYQPVAYHHWALHGTVVAQQIGYGPGLQLGYEYLTYVGFFVRATLGVALEVYLGTWRPQPEPYLSGSLGVGWKL